MLKAESDLDWRDGFLFVGKHPALDFLNTRPVLYRSGRRASAPRDRHSNTITPIFNRGSFGQPKSGIPRRLIVGGRLAQSISFRMPSSR